MELPFEAARLLRELLSQRLFGPMVGIADAELRADLIGSQGGQIALKRRPDPCLELGGVQRSERFDPG